MNLVFPIIAKLLQSHPPSQRQSWLQQFGVQQRYKLLRARASHQQHAGILKLHTGLECLKREKGAQ